MVVDKKPGPAKPSDIDRLVKALEAHATIMARCTLSLLHQHNGMDTADVMDSSGLYNEDIRELFKDAKG